MSGSTRISDLGGDARAALRGIGRMLRWAALLLVIAWLLTGIKTVDANSVGFVRRFGRVDRGPLGSGLTLLLPWPIERLDTLPVKVVQRKEGGFSAKTARMHVALRPPPAADVPYCLTGDENIIHVSMIAQYRINNPSQYRYETQEPEAILVHVLNDAVITCTAQMGVDTVLTTGKDTLLRRTREAAQKILNDLGTGLHITGELQFETPPTVPRQTAAAFQSVVDAKVGMETATSKATELATRIKAEAEGSAALMRAEAEAARHGREQQAEADKKRFLDLLGELAGRKGTDRVARLRVYMRTLTLQTLDEVMSKVRKFVLPAGAGGVMPSDAVPPALRPPG